MHGQAIFRGILEIYEKRSGNFTISYCRKMVFRCASRVPYTLHTFDGKNLELLYRRSTGHGCCEFDFFLYYFNPILPGAKQRIQAVALLPSVCGIHILYIWLIFVMVISVSAAHRTHAGVTLASKSVHRFSVFRRSLPRSLICPRCSCVHYAHLRDMGVQAFVVNTSRGAIIHN